MIFSSPLTNPFPRFAEADWRTAVAKTASRAPDALASQSDDGIAIRPLYDRRSGGHVVNGRQPGQPWQIVERLTAVDPTGAADQCAAAVAGGATGFEIVFKTSAHPLPGGLAPEDASDVARAIAGSLPHDCAVRIDAGEATHAIVAPFREGVGERPSRLVHAYDPIAALAAGRSRRSIDEVTAEIGLTAAFLDRSQINGTVVIADGRPWHAGGASQAQELAVALATAVFHLRFIEASAGLLPDRAAMRIGIALAADADQYLTIAKFRAMRLLLGRVFEAARLPSPAIPIHAETAWRMMSRRDPLINVLRTTVAAFSAAAGGADSIAVLPCDAVLGVNEASARRLARNTQTILAEEAHLFRVIDPAAGSGAIEDLTAALAETAWRRFRTIEADGGILSTLRSGSLQREIAASRRARMDRVRRGEIEMVGVNVHVDTARHTPASKRHPTRPAVDEEVKALLFERLSHPFEGEPEPAAQAANEQ